MSYNFHLLPYNENILDTLLLIICVNGYIEYAFQLCCKYGQINTTKWLIMLDAMLVTLCIEKGYDVTIFNNF